jgi:hypothetical protein
MANGSQLVDAYITIFKEEFPTIFGIITLKINIINEAMIYKP